MANTCSFALTEAQCETHPGSGGVNLIGCLWDANTTTCVPNYTCDDYGTEPVCYDGGVNDQPLFVDVMCDATVEATCESAWFT